MAYSSFLPIFGRPGLFTKYFWVFFLSLTWIWDFILLIFEKRSTLIGSVNKMERDRLSSQKLKREAKLFVLKWSAWQFALNVLKRSNGWVEIKRQRIFSLWSLFNVVQPWSSLNIFNYPPSLVKCLFKCIKDDFNEK